MNAQQESYHRWRPTLWCAQCNPEQTLYTQFCDRHRRSRARWWTLAIFLWAVCFYLGTTR